MYDDTDQLNDAFAAHEHLAPNADDVLAKAQGIARSYQRRRWAVRATGGAVLGAGLVASGIALPGKIGHSSPKTSAASTSSKAGTTKSGLSLLQPGDQPSDSPSPTPTDGSGSYTQQDELDAYFAAGYDYNDAQALAQQWGETDIVKVKSEAGLKLLNGDNLPVPPSGTPETQADQDEDAFLNAGYDYNDAQQLATMWNETDITHVKVEAGQKLLAGDQLPIPPSSGGGTSSTGDDSPAKDAARQAFFAAGYDYEDSVTLAKRWNETDTYEVKAEAGQKLLDGESLPIPPSGPPQSTPDVISTGAGSASAKALAKAAKAAGNAASGGTVTVFSLKDQNAFFGAGYTYADAVKLGKLWKIKDVTQVKAVAGKKLLSGHHLPIAP